MLIAVPIAASIKALIAKWFDARVKNDYEMYKQGQEIVEEMPEHASETAVTD